MSDDGRKKMNPLDFYEAAAFYRSAALSGESVTGHEYDAAFDYWDDTDFSNVNPDDYYGAGQLCKSALGLNPSCPVCHDPHGPSDTCTQDYQRPSRMFNGRF